MIWKFINKGEVILSLVEETINDESINKIEELTENRSVTSIEIIFKKGTSMDEADDAFGTVSSNEAIEELRVNLEDSLS